MKRLQPNPKRGEVWIYNPGKTIGSEMKKERRAVVVSADAMGVLRVKLIVPLTGWSDSFKDTVWHVRIDPDPNNGITKAVAADVMLMRSASLDRFITRVGRVSADTMEEISAAIAAVVEFK